MNCIATLVTNDDYVDAAATLAFSIRQHSDLPLIVLCPPSLSSNSIAILGRYFLVSYIPLIHPLSAKNAANLLLLDRPNLAVTFSKLHFFNPNVIPYDSVLFLDADTLILQNLDRVFESDACFAAAPDAGWPDIFNSGVFVAKPNLQLYSDLIEFASDNASFDGADQGLLNSFFKNWSSDSPSEYSSKRNNNQIHSYKTRRLSFTFNVTPSAVYTYLTESMLNLSVRANDNTAFNADFLGSKYCWPKSEVEPMGEKFDPRHLSDTSDDQFVPISNVSSDKKNYLNNVIVPPTDNPESFFRGNVHASESELTRDSTVQQEFFPCAENNGFESVEKHQFRYDRSSGLSIFPKSTDELIDSYTNEHIPNHNKHIETGFWADTDTTSNENNNAKGNNLCHTYDYRPLVDDISDSNPESCINSQSMTKSRFSNDSEGNFKYNTQSSATVIDTKGHDKIFQKTKGPWSKAANSGFIKNLPSHNRNESNVTATATLHHDETTPENYIMLVLPTSSASNFFFSDTKDMSVLFRRRDGTTIEFPHEVIQIPVPSGLNISEYKEDILDYIHHIMAPRPPENSELQDSEEESEENYGTSEIELLSEWQLRKLSPGFMYMPKSDYEIQGLHEPSFLAMPVSGPVNKSTQTEIQQLWREGENRIKKIGSVQSLHSDVFLVGKGLEYGKTELNLGSEVDDSEEEGWGYFTPRASSPYVHIAEAPMNISSLDRKEFTSELYRRSGYSNREFVENGGLLMKRHQE